MEKYTAKFGQHALSVAESAYSAIYDKKERGEILAGGADAWVEETLDGLGEEMPLTPTVEVRRDFANSIKHLEGYDDER